MSESSGRPGAKLAVKEAVRENSGKKSGEKRGFFNDLFSPHGNQQKNQLVPARKPLAGSASERYGKRKQSNSTLSGQSAMTSTEDSSPRAAVEEKTETKKTSPVREKNSRGNSIRTQETIVTPRGEKPGQSVAMRTNRSPVKKKDPANSGLRFLLLLIILIGGLGYYYQTQNHFKPGMQAFQEGTALSPDVIRERVKFHRDQVGHKLNRERMNVQVQNTMSTTYVSPSLRKGAETDMMMGLPLAGEQINRPNGRDRTEPLDSSYADAHVQYDLKEQQDLNEWEKVAQKQYVDEFVANAARAGYQVKVDKNGNVIVVGRKPAANGSLPLPRAADKGADGPTGSGSIH